MNSSTSCPDSGLWLSAPIVPRIELSIRRGLSSGCHRSIPAANKGATRRRRVSPGAKSATEDGEEDEAWPELNHKFATALHVPFFTMLTGYALPSAEQQPQVKQETNGPQVHR